MPASTGSAVLTASATFNEAFGNFGTDALVLKTPGLNASLTVGSGANQFNNCYAASLTITSGTPVELNLTNGSSLKNPDGTFAVFTDIVFLYIFNGGTTGQSITIGAGTTPVTSIWGSTGTEIILPGAYMVKAAFLAAGFAVTASTACELQLTVAAGTNVPYDIMILGH